MSRPSRSYRAVFFDLDGTLLDEGEPFRLAVEATCREFCSRHAGIEPIELAPAFFRVSEAVWSGLSNITRGYISGGVAGQSIRTQLWSKALETLGFASDHAGEAALIYAEQRRLHYRLFEDASPVLQTIRDEGITIGVVTNGSPEVQREKSSLSGLDSLVDFVVVSGEVGAGKPDPRPFLKALTMALVEPGDVLFVGDSLVNDVGGSQGVGMTAAWLNRTGALLPPGAARPDIQISALSPLLGHLGIGEGPRPR